MWPQHTQFYKHSIRISQAIRVDPELPSNPPSTVASPCSDQQCPLWVQITSELVRLSCRISRGSFSLDWSIFLASVSWILLPDGPVPGWGGPQSALCDFSILVGTPQRVPCGSQAHTVLIFVPLMMILCFTTWLR